MDAQQSGDDRAERRTPRQPLGSGYVSTGLYDPPEPVELSAGSRRSWLVFLVCFLALAAILLIKNRHLFWTPIHEEGDDAANSIIVEDAKHLDLLVGNYSRFGFSHPGPATFYVEALGEVVLRDALDVVPTPFNGHLVAVILFGAGLVALALTIVWANVPSGPAILVAFAMVLAFAAAHPPLLVSTWMPFVHVAPFLLLLVSAASVAAGNSRHLWALGIAGGILVHGHVAFALFVPITAAVALLSCVVARRRAGRRPVFPPTHVVAFGCVIALFLLPILLNLALHWPGELRKYLAYATSSQASGHEPGTVLRYVLQYWSTGPEERLALIPVVLGAALTVAATHPVARARRFLLSCLAFALLESALVFAYAIRGIDDLGQIDVCYFYWAAPLTVGMMLTIAIVTRIEHMRGAIGLIGASALALVLWATRDGLLVSGYGGTPALPDVVARLAAARAAPDQTIVIDLAHDSWPDAVAILVGAHRERIPVCMNDPTWTFMVTSRFICHTDQRIKGRWIRFRPPGQSGEIPLAELPRSEITAQAKPAP